MGKMVILKVLMGVSKINLIFFKAKAIVNLKEKKKIVSKKVILTLHILSCSEGHYFLSSPSTRESKR